MRAVISCGLGWRDVDIKVMSLCDQGHQNHHMLSFHKNIQAAVHLVQAIDRVRNQLFCYCRCDLSPMGLDYSTITLRSHQNHKNA